MICMLEVEVDEALNQMTLARLQEMTTNTINMTGDKMSQKLCLVRREDVNKVRSDLRVSPITENIQSEIAYRLRVF